MMMKFYLKLFSAVPTKRQIANEYTKFLSRNTYKETNKYKQQIKTFHLLYPEREIMNTQNLHC